MSDYLTEYNSPTRQEQEPIKYAFQLNFDDTEIHDFDEEITDYDDICDKFYKMVDDKTAPSFETCKIQRISTNYEIEPETIFTINMMEVMRKILRYFHLLKHPTDKTSDEIVEMNEIVKYLTFKI